MDDFFPFAFPTRRRRKKGWFLALRSAENERQLKELRKERLNERREVKERLNEWVKNRENEGVKNKQ